MNNSGILFKNIVNSRKVTLIETRDALIELWEMLNKLKKPLQKKNKYATPLERVRDIFIDAKGFVVKSNLRELTNCFWVEPNWEEYEIHQQRLGKQLLVCVLDSLRDVEDIYNYLYSQGRKSTISEIVFLFKDYSAFKSEDRKNIRERFKGRYLKCIFIQEKDFKSISKTQNWRNLFYRIVEISKIS